VNRAHTVAQVTSTPRVVTPRRPSTRISAIAPNTSIRIAPPELHQRNDVRKCYGSRNVTIGLATVGGDAGAEVIPESRRELTQ
jgi:hypothetical protein